MREKVKELWRLCFNDTEEFIDLYFSLRYNKDVNVAIESGDEVIAALQMLPYPMTFCNENVSTSYVSGACTHPGYRNRGVMHELLSQAFGRMYRNNVAFSTLIPAEPWLFDYYARAGYAPVFRYGRRTFHLPPDVQNSSLPALSSETLVLSSETPALSSGTPWVLRTYTDYNEEAYNYLNRKMLERPCCLQHTETDFRVILADLNLSNGHLFTLSNGQEVVALAVAYPGEKSSTPQINELLSDTPEAEHLLLSYICRKMRTDTLDILMPPVQDQPSFPLGMIRIIRLQPVLHLYAATHPQAEMNIELSDNELSANNGYYYLNRGKCMYSHRRLPGVHEHLSIGQLADKIFSSEHAYMSLMLK
ncbi:GNAT family N-acetyltransferase [Bacteroides sp. UBA939]|uniref:GNAT family N-acetyltransferase n=1 Tax=Bacteroides sp. UBA939 TaxID=1946092 RepID=UPI0025BD7A55|nr:GNAT family N-acetyltransferase [Bacteroides sp. UBA939]